MTDAMKVKSSDFPYHTRKMIRTSIPTFKQKSIFNEMDIDQTKDRSKIDFKKHRKAKRTAACIDFPNRKRAART